VPTYQYTCTECSHGFEQVQAFTDPSLSECPECSGRLRKVYGSVGVVFKGSGFYRTDSRAGSGETTSAKSDSGSAEKPAAKKDGATTKSDGGSSGTSGSSAAKPAAGSTSGSSSSSGSSGSSATKAAS